MNLFKQKQLNTIEMENNILYRHLLVKEYSPRVHELQKLYTEAAPKSINVAELKKLVKYPTCMSQAKILYSNQAIIDGIDILLQDCDFHSLNLPMPIICSVNTDVSLKLVRMFRLITGSKQLPGDSTIYKEVHGHGKEEMKEYVYALCNISSLMKIFETCADDMNVDVIDIGDISELLRMPTSMRINIAKQQTEQTYQAKAATLLMSEECNLRCTYCYEPNGKRNKQVMTFDTAKSALRKFSPDSKITFFGGEPMMQKELMQQICEWGWENRNFNFEIITNGQIIDRPFMRDYMRYFSYVQLSVDGPEHVHDLNRGHGSFKKAMEFADAYFEETDNHKLFLFPVLHRTAIPELFTTVKWFREKAHEYQMKHDFRILPGDAGLWTEDDLKLMQEQVDIITEWAIKERLNKDPYFNIEAFVSYDASSSGKKHTCNCGDGKCETPQFENPTASYGMQQFCAAGTSLYVVMPDGRLGSCHHHQWSGITQRSWDYIGLNEDPTDVNNLGQMTTRDIPKCNDCEQWGCSICPGSFYSHSKSYDTPDKVWCAVGKMWIAAAKKYGAANKKGEQLDGQAINVLTAGLNYLLEKDKNGNVHTT